MGSIERASLRIVSVVFVLPMLGFGCLPSQTTTEAETQESGETSQLVATTISADLLVGDWELVEGSNVQWIDFSEDGTYYVVNDFLPFNGGTWEMAEDGFHLSREGQEDFVFPRIEYVNDTLTLADEEGYMILQKYVDPPEPADATATFLVAYEDYKYPAVGDLPEFDAVIQEALSAGAFDLIEREFVPSSKAGPDEAYALYSFTTNYWDSIGVPDPPFICTGSFGDGYNTCLLVHETVDGMEPVRLFDNFNTYSALVSANETDLTWELLSDDNGIGLRGSSEDGVQGQVLRLNTQTGEFEPVAK